MKEILALIAAILKSKFKRLKNYLNLRHIQYIGNNYKIDYPATFLGIENVSIGKNFSCRSGLKLRAFKLFNNQNFSPMIKIGNNVIIENNCHIGCVNKIIIDDDVLIASNVFISDHTHGNNDYSDISKEPIKRNLSSKGPIHIGKKVWIGENVVILGGVNIGQNSIIAASSVVNKDVPEFSIVAGAPAKVVKFIR